MKEQSSDGNWAVYRAIVNHRIESKNRLNLIELKKMLFLGRFRERLTERLIL